MAGMSQARWDIMVKGKMVRIQKGTGFGNKVRRIGNEVIIYSVDM